MLLASSSTPPRSYRTVNALPHLPRDAPRLPTMRLIFTWRVFPRRLDFTRHVFPAPSPCVLFKIASTPLWHHSTPRFQSAALLFDSDADAALLRRCRRRHSPPTPLSMMPCHLTGATLLARWATTALQCPCTTPTRPTSRPLGNACGSAPSTPPMKPHAPTTPPRGGLAVPRAS
jgi:hypothetical protein